MSKHLVKPNFFESFLSLNLQTHIKNIIFSLQRASYTTFVEPENPKHLLCFKQWNAKKVKEIIISAMNLKCMYENTHNTRLGVLPNTKVMILQELNEPVLNLAVSKAATLLGAVDVNITDGLIWDHDYYGKIFSEMADVIFVATKTHMCFQRFAGKSTVPVVCMISRTHATLQALATIMSIMEEFGTMRGLNVAYIGSPHPVLNSYLLLCPMLGANIKFKICCQSCPISPLLLRASKELTEKTATQSKQCEKREQALKNVSVVVSGPTPTNKDLLKDFSLTSAEIAKNTEFRWIFYHTCPRGEEVDNELFWGNNSRTFNAFLNLQYVAAALMANAVGDYRF